MVTIEFAAICDQCKRRDNTVLNFKSSTPPFPTRFMKTLRDKGWEFHRDQGWELTLTLCPECAKAKLPILYGDKR